MEPLEEIYHTGEFCYWPLKSVYGERDLQGRLREQRAPRRGPRPTHQYRLRSPRAPRLSYVEAKSLGVCTRCQYDVARPGRIHCVSCARIVAGYQR